MQRSVRDGHAERPQDARRCNGKSPDVCLSVEAFLQDMFDSVAEWMPTACDVVAPAAPALPEWLAAPSAAVGPSATAVTAGRNGVRYLAHQSLQDLFYTCQSQESPDRAASYTTFLRVFGNWRHMLLFGAMALLLRWAP